jgi:CRP-like cAMP-binding protein
LLTGDPYSATVVARTDAALIFIEKLEFAKLLQANDGLASELSNLVAKRSEMNRRSSDADLAQPGLREQIYRKIIHFFGLKPHINAKKESSHKVLV